MLDPRAFLINNRTGRVVAATFIEFLNGTTTEPSVCFTNSPDSGMSCDSAGAVHYVKNGTDLGELGTTTNLIGGSNTQIQYNDNGSFGGSADLTWDDSAKELGVGGDINLDDGGTYSTTLQMVTPTANRTISFPDATGTVALVAGSSGQVLSNQAGALAGGNLSYDATAGTFGYGTGRGTVTQQTNKSTGVTLNAPCGAITMNGAALSADTTVSFTLTNTSIAATDLLILNHVSGGTVGSYVLNAQAAAGSASINVTNISTGSLSEAIVIGFAIIKG